MKNAKQIKLFLLTFAILISSKYALAESEIKKLDWNGLQVVWLVDERMPTYELLVHFADGSLGDESAYKGETNMMFSQLSSGTNRFNQKQIADNLEFYGVSTGVNITHESTTYRVSGLIKDMAPSVKQICHLFKDSIFPQEELNKTKARIFSELRGISSNPKAVASISFRQLSLKGTPYSYPVSGKRKDIVKLNRKRLRSKLDYFNKKVAKRIYISGPKEVLNLKNILNKDCDWNGQGKIVREVAYMPKAVQDRPEIILVTIPKANQAQVRVGRFLNEGEYDDDVGMSLATHYLGGGFTSRLMQEIRVKRGLSYGVSAYAGGQRQYGRTVISTFTKSKTVDKLLGVLKETLTATSSEKGITDKRFSMAVSGLSGAHPFRFESRSAYLSQLKYLDNRGKSYDELYKFSDKVLKLTKKNLAENINNLYNWSNMTVVVVGTKSLLPKLKKFGKVKVINYKKFL